MATSRGRMAAAAPQQSWTPTHKLTFSSHLKKSINIKSAILSKLTRIRIDEIRNQRHDHGPRERVHRDLNCHPEQVHDVSLDYQDYPLEPANRTDNTLAPATPGSV